ncbi:MAG: hypothetical protein OJF51_005084 [Nitrospira sp.]|jgi:hypothetical protein|nr:MAG: hypothetical protein OJF51_005084 [Nitrospira sp.]
MVRIAFFQSEGKERVAGPAWPNLEVRNAMLVDFSGEEELSRVIAHESLIAEFHNGQSVVEGFKGGFLSFASEHMPEDKDRLALTLDTEILQRSLSAIGAGKPTVGACSNPGHNHLFQPDPWLGSNTD